MNDQPRTPPLVSIVIVNYNGEEFIEACLRSVWAQEYRPIEVIVVDNGSHDRSIELIRANFADVRLILNPVNTGFARANNQGVANANGEFVVLLNNDTVVYSQWLIALIGAMEPEDVGAAMSKVITEGVPAKFSEMNGSLNYLGYNVMRVFSDLSQVFFAAGTSLIFRKDVVHQPFLDVYFLYHEDVFLSWRLRLLGYRIVMAQDSIVHHRGSATTKRQRTSFITFYQERNRALNALLFFEFRTLILLVPYFVLELAAKFLLSLMARGKSPSGILSAYWWLVTNSRWIATERRSIQAHRRLSDKDIMRMMSSRVIDSEHPAAKAINACSRFYAQVVGLAHYE